MVGAGTVIIGISLAVTMMLTLGLLLRLLNKADGL